MRTIYHHRKRLKHQFKKNLEERKINKYTETISVTSTSFTIEEGQITKEDIRLDASVNQLVETDTVEQSEQHMPSPDNAEPISNERLDVTDDTNKHNLKEKQGGEIQYKSEPNSVKDLRKSNELDAETVRVTLLMVIVTVIFIVSFLPYLSIAVWIAIEGRDTSLFLSKAELVPYHIWVRSYLLHSALNPWIYGIFNSQFRQFFFRGCFRKRG